MKRLISVLILICIVGISPADAQRSRRNQVLAAGPMLGYVEMREALLWVQTTEAADVYFEYHPTDKPSATSKTIRYRTRKNEAYTARLIADEIEPGVTYHYHLYINGSKVRLSQDLTFTALPLWQFRTSPPDVHFALGSCMYVNDSKYDRKGEPYGGGNEIFKSILDKKPQMMFWLGDNVYLREADWYSRTGIMHRYSHTRALPEMQSLLGSVANYAIWDDHDFGPNDSDASYRDKATTLEAFKLFWGNPTYGLDGEPGITSTFENSDAQFFLLDNRYHRSAAGNKSAEATILGKAQMDWLISALVYSKARFKFICIGGQVLSTLDKFENHIHHAPAEREYLLDAIAKNQIKNVIFLTGDRHHSEMSVESRGGVRIYDFTVSPLTARAYSADEQNALRVRGSGVGERNFGTVDIYGSPRRRRVRFTLFDVNGEKLWEHDIKPQE